MGSQVYESIGGFKYIGGPYKIKAYVANAAVYRNGLLKLTSGKVEPWTSGSKPCGVAINSAAAGDEVLVSVDPEALYEVNAYSQPTVSLSVNKFNQVTEENVGLRLRDYSTMRIIHPGSTTPNTGTPVMTVGISGAVTNIAPASNHKTIVKLVMSAFEPYVDAIE